jgi:hypothetical protein
LGILAVCVLASGELTRRYEWSLLPIPFAVPVSGHEIILPLFALLPLVLTAALVHRHWDAKYEIGKDYVQATHGLLSLRRNEMRIDLPHICGVEVQQNVWQYLLGIGTIRIGSAMREDIELTIDGIRQPALYRNVITSRMAAAGMNSLEIASQ